MRSNIKKVFWVYLVLFLFLIIYLLHFILVDSKNIIGNSYNPRLRNLQDENISRGNILDRNNNILATSENGERIYLYDEVFSHTIGFLENGSSGIESKYNFTLQNLNNEILQRIKKQLNQENVLQGNSLVLTLDKDLQLYSYEQIKDTKGSIVVMDNTTGEILSMVSSPGFSPSNISSDWNELNSDEENTPLLNRATQGLYPPASVFKILTAVAFIENYENFENYTYECKGYETFGDIEIHCYNNNAHGTLNLEDALAVSCNTFFAKLSEIISPNQLTLITEKALFNSALNFELEYKSSSFSLTNKSDISEIVQTYIGQGKTLVTPLHMALIGSGIANNGIIMKPYIVSKEINYNGKEINIILPEKLTTAFSVETSHILKNMLQKVITEGTGTNAQVDNISISGKTGTAQVDGQKDHTWFLGMAPTENPNLVVCVMLENSGENSNVSKIAGNIIRYYFEKE